MWDRRLATLAQIPLFASLTETEIQALAQRAVERRFAPEEMLFWEGEPCAGIFLIVQGSVKIFKTSPGGREMMLALETRALDGGGAAALRRRAVPGIGAGSGAGGRAIRQQGDFQQVCRQYPEVALKVLAVVGRRLRHLVGVVEAMTFGSVTQRLARLLLDASRQAGADEFDLPLTHQELASRLGTVREVVSRNLARFRAEGLLQVQGHRISLLDRAGIERESEPQG